MKFCLAMFPLIFLAQTEDTTGQMVAPSSMRDGMAGNQTFTQQANRIVPGSAEEDLGVILFVTVGNTHSCVRWNKVIYQLSTIRSEVLHEWKRLNIFQAIYIYIYVYILCVCVFVFVSLYVYIYTHIYDIHSSTFSGMWVWFSTFMWQKYVPSSDDFKLSTMTWNNFFIEQHRNFAWIYMSFQLYRVVQNMVRTIKM